MIIAKSKKGQMIIWVILAIAIVATIIVIFLFKIKPGFIPQQVSSPETFIQKCVRDKMLEISDAIMPQGGFANPKDYKLYEDNKVAFLCKGGLGISGCINQHSSLIEEIKSEIAVKLGPEIENCFGQLKADAEKRGETISYGATTSDISLLPGRISLSVDKKTTITKGSNSQVINDYKIDLSSPLYELASVAIEITNSETRYCYFEYVGYMILHPELSIERWVLSDNTKIYIIEDKETTKKMNIAITSSNCNPGARI